MNQSFERAKVTTSGRRAGGAARSNWARWATGSITLTTAMGCDAQVEPGYEGEALIELDGRVEALTSETSDTAVGVLWLMGSEADGCSGPKLACSFSATGAVEPDADYECAEACTPPPRACDENTKQAYADWAQCQTDCGLETQAFADVESHTCFSGGVTQTTPVAGEFPADFSLDVLQPPPEGAALPSDTGERVAVGLFVAVDPDADGLTFSREDREPPAWLLGASETHALMYAQDAVSADSTWGKHLGGAYTPGYHLVRVVFGNRCGLPMPRTDDDRDVDSMGDTFTGSPDAGAPTTEEESVPHPDEPDYSGVPYVCGNGVCEQSENCDICSDCVECDAKGRGKDSNVTSRESESYRCFSTASHLQPALGDSETEILLKVGDLGTIDFPRL